MPGKLVDDWMGEVDHAVSVEGRERGREGWSPCLNGFFVLVPRLLKK